jgi:hypothetical protein
MRRVTPLVWVRFGLVSLTVSVMMASEGHAGERPSHQLRPASPRADRPHLHS